MKQDQKKIEQQIEQLPDNPPEDKIESTASDLEGMHYEPMLLRKVPGFLRMKKEALLKEVDATLSLPESELSDELKEKQVDLLLYQYELLTRLRQGEPEAWDTINELYEDD